MLKGKKCIEQEHNVGHLQNTEENPLEEPFDRLDKDAMQFVGL